MRQTKKDSLKEAGVNIMVGYTVNVTANAFILPLFGWVISTRENLTLGLAYTAVSLIRTYAIRRFFNRGN